MLKFTCSVNVTLWKIKEAKHVPFIFKTPESRSSSKPWFWPKWFHERSHSILYLPYIVCGWEQMPSTCTCEVKFPNWNIHRYDSTAVKKPWATATCWLGCTLLVCFFLPSCKTPNRKSNGIISILLYGATFHHKNSTESSSAVLHQHNSAYQNTPTHPDTHTGPCLDKLELSMVWVREGRGELATGVCSAYSLNASDRPRLKNDMVLKQWKPRAAGTMCCFNCRARGKEGKKNH